MYEFKKGIAFGCMTLLVGRVVYEIGKTVGRKEKSKDRKTISDELVGILEALRKKIES